MLAQVILHIVTASVQTWDFDFRLTFRTQTLDFSDNYCLIVHFIIFCQPYQDILSVPVDQFQFPCFHYHLKTVLYFFCQDLFNSQSSRQEDICRVKQSTKTDNARHLRTGISVKASSQHSSIYWKSFKATKQFTKS